MFKQSENINSYQSLIPFIVKDSKLKHKRYQKIKSRMRYLWEKHGYKEKNGIAFLLADHIEESIMPFLYRILPFRKESLKYGNIVIPSAEDFNVDIKYTFSKQEQEFITSLIQHYLPQKNLASATLCKWILLASIISFNPIINSFFKENFVTMMNGMNASERGDELEIIISTKARTK